MSITKEDIIQSISDGNLNPKMLRKFFNDIKLRSFSYDHRIQKDIVSYFSTSFTFEKQNADLREGVFTDGIDRYYRVDIHHKFLIAGEKEKYKRSDIFNAYLKEEEITKWNKYFLYYPVIFVDGVLFTNYRMKVHHDMVSFYFLQSDLNKIAALNDGATNKDFIAKGGNIIFMPNSIGGVIDLAPSDFHGTNLMTDKFSDDLKKFFPKYNKYIGFFISKTDGTSIMIPSMEYNPGGWFTLIDQPPTDISKYSIMVIGCQYIKSWTNIGNSVETWLEFTSEKMPLPKDNLMVFVRKGVSWIPDNTVEIQEYYPNIFKVVNPEEKFIRLVALYEEETQNSHIVYDEEIAPYLKRINLLDRYKSDTVPEPLQEFSPVEWTYGIEDFLKKNPYTSVNMTNTWDSFIYKMQSISDMLKKWFLLYEEYERRTFGFLSGWYHNIANYDNMADKVRYNTSPDFNDEGQYEDFSEPQYVFSYYNNTKYGIAKAYCYYIDGRYTIPTKVAIAGRYQYVYLPKRLIKKDSVIEVERFDGITYNKNYEMNGTIEIPFSSISAVPTVANSIFMVDVENDTYLTKDDVKMVVVDKELGEVEVDPMSSVFIIEPSSIIKFIPSENYVGRLVKVCINNKVIQYSERESGLDYQLHGEQLINLNKNNVICGINRALLPRLRIFTNDGRLIPKRDYTVMKHDKYSENIQFHIPIPVTDDEWLKVCYIGYDERLIYHKDNLDPRGIVSIHGRTSRPFSFKYHDIYLDGFRLTKYDIEMISPYTFIVKAMKKYGTNRVIEIYEKCHPNDNFVKFDYNEESEYIMDKLINTQKDFYDIIYESLEACTIDERLRAIDDYRDHWYDFFMYWIPYNFIQPDERRDLEAFFHLMTIKEERVLLNPDERVKYSKIVKDTIFLNRDETLAHGQDDPPIKNRELDVCSVIPDKSIVVDEKEYREHGYFDYNFNPVYDEPYVPQPDTSEPTDIDPNAKRHKEEYEHKVSFPHTDDTERYESGKEEIEEIEFVEFNQDFYKMSDVYPGYYNSMETIPDKFDDPGLTDMSFMYQGCANLRNILNIGTSEVTNMMSVCDGCTKLAALPSGFDTSKVKNFNYAFRGCKSLPYLSPRFNFGSVESAIGMFEGCESLPSIFPITIDCSSIVNAGKLTDMFKDSSVSVVILRNVSESVRAEITEDLLGVTSIMYE